MIYLGEFVPKGLWPTKRRRDYDQFVLGYSFAFAVLSVFIASGAVPSRRNFEAELDKIEREGQWAGPDHSYRGTPKDYLYFKERGGTPVHVLKAVLSRAAEEIDEGEMWETFGDELEVLPECKVHDEDFDSVRAKLMVM